MTKHLPIIGIIWLVALVCFVLGAATVHYHIFPHRILQPAFKEIVAFWKGHPADKRPIGRRLWAEMTFDPFAFALTPSPFPMQLQLRPVDTSSYRGPTIQFLDNAQYYSDGSLKGYFLIYGSFAFEDTNWGAILLSMEGQVVRGWSIEPEEYEYPGAHIGLALSETGDLATNTHGVLTSYSWCGKKNWEAEWEKRPERYHHDSVLGYDYHHDITYHEGRYYTFLGPEIVSVDENTGKIVQRIHVVDLIRWAREQDLAIFDTRFKKFYKGNELDASNLVNLTVFDPFHFNKVEVLTHELASSFDSLEEGDMLVSMRELNLVFVFRPKTSEIPWYRYGLTSRQHDATFQRGYISVFDNNPYAKSGPSPRIIALEVDSYSRSILFDLKRWGAKMEAKGNFEFDDDNHVLAFSDDENGRAVVGKLSGKPMFVFENRVESGKSLELRNITRISLQKFEEWSSVCN